MLGIMKQQQWLATAIARGQYRIAKMFSPPNLVGLASSDNFQLAGVNSTYLFGRSQNDTTNSNEGVIYVYDLATLSYVRKIDNPNPSAGDLFTFVGADDTYLWAAAYGEDVGGYTNAGAVYVFRISDWTLIDTITNPNTDSTAGDWFFGGRTSVNPGKTRVAIGAINNYGSPADNSGVVYVYDFTTRSLLQTIKNPNDDGANSSGNTDWFGYGALDINDDGILLVNAYQEDGPTYADEGVSYIFDTSDGSLLHTLYNPNPTATGNRFGVFSTINSQYAFIGDDSKTGTGTSDDRVYVFRVSDGGLETTIYNPNIRSVLSSTTSFGSCRATDDYLIVADLQEEDPYAAAAGRVYVFRLSDFTLEYSFSHPRPFWQSGSNSNITNVNFLTDDYAGLPNSTTAFSGYPFLLSRNPEDWIPWFSYRAETTSSASTIAVSSHAEEGDLAVLFDYSTTTTLVVPSGFTQISTATTTGTRITASYRVLTASDIGATITGMGGTTRKILLIINPNKTIESVTVSTPSQEATTGNPVAQTISMDGNGYPIIGFAHYASTGVISPRTSTVSGTAYTMAEISNTTRQYVKYIHYNAGGTSDVNVSVDMDDEGTNALQSFYITIT